MTKKTLSLVPNGERKVQYVVNWELNGEGKGEVFDTRAGLYKLVRQLKAVGVPHTIVKTTIAPMTTLGE